MTFLINGRSPRFRVGAAAEGGTEGAWRYSDGCGFVTVGRGSWIVWADDLPTIDGDGAAFAGFSPEITLGMWILTVDTDLSVWLDGGQMVVHDVTETLTTTDCA